MPERPAAELQVLVVDDSAVVRQFVPAILSEAGMKVVTASDPVIAMTKMKTFRPDVILLDIEMPRMDGLTFLRQLMAEDPIPVVICSGHAGKGTDKALQALEDGAVEVLAKPQFGMRVFLEESSKFLIDTVHAAAQARLRGPGRAPRVSARVLPDAAAWAPRYRSHLDSLVVIGASTGGPEALRGILAALPAEFPGTVIAQHMPGAFTGPFAQRLDELSALEVEEAVDGARVDRGRVLVAPGGAHTLICSEGSGFSVRVTSGPLVWRHRPSIDVLFGSAAEAAEANALGVLLTGMGKDGVEGLAQLREAGADTVAQHEDGCVVFGMPKEAIAKGAAHAAVRLEHMAEALIGRAERIDRGCRRQPPQAMRMTQQAK